jgi:lipid II:glycine glycyltransferase (peptidoglycan interpeptide bridge formation enzyme)
LPWRKKWGFYYLYQPFLTAQLGLFGKGLSADLLKYFLLTIPSKFKLWDFPLNTKNVYQISGFTLQLRTNFILPLHNSYESLYAEYRQNVKRNIKKALQYNCTITKSIDIDAVMDLAKRFTSGISNYMDDLDRFLQLYHDLDQKKQACCYGVYSSRKELMASCVFFFSHQRAYYILVGNHPNGKTLGASHLLIDSFIKDHAGSNLILDFEGSDIPSLAFFYSSFGAIEEKYSYLKRNQLPWYIRLVKK